jgi:hypothetical protein
MLIVDPRHVKRRKLKVLPRLTKSSTERLDPSLQTPIVDKVDPNRRKLRRDMLLPR